MLLLKGDDTNSSHSSVSYRLMSRNQCGCQKYGHAKTVALLFSVPGRATSPL